MNTINVTTKINLTVPEIKALVDSGQSVYYRNKSYPVIHTATGQWFIRCTFNGYCIGLTDLHGNLNGKPSDFFSETR
jgi:hypothetical protein